MKIKISYICCTFLLVYVSPICVTGQESHYEEPSHNDITHGKRHLLAINPIKPFIGLPNLHYEYQIRKKLGIAVFSEVMAYRVIPDFNHPDAVNTIGLSYYPFVGDRIINQGPFINLNTSLVLYNRDKNTENSLANGIQIGYKQLFGGSLFLEPKLVSNYTYKNNRIVPGFELLLGINL